MNTFTYSYPTKVYFGEGAATGALRQELAGVRTVLLAYGGGSVRKNGIYDEITGVLAEMGIQTVDFSGVMPNPTYEKVQEGVKIAREAGADYILAVGGGSVIDCCKIVAAQAVTDEDIWEMEFTQRKFRPAAGGGRHRFRHRGRDERRRGHHQRGAEAEDRHGRVRPAVCRPRPEVHPVGPADAGDFGGV